MKQILTILTITLLLTSCGKEQTQSTESIIEAGNVEALRTKKTALTTQAATIKDELAQIEKAIETLDPAA